jgi:morphogenetic protein associated with SpoVID
VKIHMVKKGDTLYLIAQKYNVELDKLIALNPQITDPNVIEVGMKVKIPTTPKPVVPPTDYLYKHVVTQGDTLWKLGKAWNVPLNEMIEANPQLKNPSVLMTGELVYIPKVKPHPAHHSDHHYQGGYGNPKKNTAPIETMPAVPMPMPSEIQPQVNMPNEEISPSVEMPNTQMPNVEMPFHPMPNIEMPSHQMPNVEMPYNQMPNVEMPQFQMPAMEHPVMPNVNQPTYVSPFSENVPDLMPEVLPNMPNMPNMSMQEPSANLFQQFQVPATEVLSHDFSDMHQVSWMEPESMPMMNMPSATHMPYDAYNAPMPSYPMYNQPILGGDCGCGGPQYPGYNQVMPYNLAPHMEMPMMEHPHMGYPNAAYPSAMYPQHHYPHMALPLTEQPCFPHGYDPLAMTSAYPGPGYPMNPYPMGNPYGGYPYGVKKDCDCGCGDKSRGGEEQGRASTQSSASTKAAAKNSTPSGSNKKRTTPAQASISRLVQRANSRRSSTSKSKSGRSPWINV